MSKRLWSIFTLVFDFLESGKKRVYAILMVLIAIVGYLGIQKFEASLWLTFAAIFYYLAFHHWELSKLEISNLFGTDSRSIIMMSLSSETPSSVIALMQQFNSKSRDLNIALARGYLAATGTALLSCVVAVFTK